MAKKPGKRKLIKNEKDLIFYFGQPYYDDFDSKTHYKRIIFGHMVDKAKEK